MGRAPDYPTLNRFGVGVYRLASSEFSVPLSNAISAVASKDEYIEVRKPLGETDEIRGQLGIPLLKPEVLRNLWWPRKKTPLAPIVRSLDENITLQQPRLLSFHRSQVSSNRHGEQFLSLVADTESCEALVEDFQSALPSLEPAFERSSLTPGQHIRIPALELNVAFAFPEASPDAWNDVVQFVGSLIPLELKFDPALVIPKPDELDQLISRPTA